jgi:hypothetical protein
LTGTRDGHYSFTAEKGGAMKRKNKQSKDVLIATLYAVTAMFNFLANLVHYLNK